MKYDDLVRLVGDLPLIDTQTLRTLGSEPRGLSVQLCRWARAGRLVQLRRGAYLLPEHLCRSPVPRERLANLLVSPSYVSLERSLSIHGLIPEGVPLVQSVTTARPAALSTPIGEFSYRHVKPSWFFGYEELEVGGGRALVARPEKALLDLIYLAHGEFGEPRLAELRLQELSRLDGEELSAMARASGQGRVVRAAQRLRRLAEREGEGTVEL
jgi:predicted transcriptional regulator of viral defense system